MCFPEQQKPRFACSLWALGTGHRDLLFSFTARSLWKATINPTYSNSLKGLACQEGEGWARHRRIINPAFHLEKLLMLPAFSISCSKMIEQWKKMVNHQESCEVDVWPELQNLTMDIISRAAFGSNYEEGKRFAPTKKNRRRRKLNKEIIISNSRSASLMFLFRFSQNASGTIRDDLSIEEVIEECKQCYLAGKETTSSWLTWAMIVLALHPEWQEMAREEVLQVCGQKEPNFEALIHLKIVNMILNEVLRLYPPVISLYQHTYKETRIGNIHLPARVDLTLPMLLIHHDPELWGDDEFSRASKDQLALFPFGWSPRTCIGRNFAMLEAKMALAMILQNFEFNLSPSYIHAPHTVMRLQPQHGAQIIIHQL
ncbi:hypothetical protein BDE02_05G108800 [Populus trichocarpa]|nr:hypothetical protein BDE02_05G108800 [Populus trichocarpa]